MNSKQTFLALALLFCSSISLPLAAQSGITVIVKNIEKKHGKLHILLYNKTGEWLADGAYFKKAKVNVNSEKVSYTFANLPAGSYAVTLFHDADNSGEMNYNWLGIPTETFGFSNNPRVLVKAPSYEAAEVILKQNMMEVDVALQGI